MGGEADRQGCLRRGSASPGRELGPRVSPGSCVSPRHARLLSWGMSEPGDQSAPCASGPEVGEGLPGAQAAPQAPESRAAGGPDRVAGERKPDRECSNPPGGPSAGPPACGPAGRPLPAPGFEATAARQAEAGARVRPRLTPGRAALASAQVPRRRVFQKPRPSAQTRLERVSGLARTWWSRGHTPSPALRQPPGRARGDGPTPPFSSLQWPCHRRRPRAERARDSSSAQTMEKGQRAARAPAGRAGGA